MLIKMTGSETYIHQCDNKIRRTKDHVYLHDVQAYMHRERNGQTDLLYIKYCPYCGVDIDSESRS